MPSVFFVAHDGESRQIAAEAGSSLMQAAVSHGVNGIVGDCGGACACATCHCYIDAAWSDRLAAPGQGERDLLDCVVDCRRESRLACQVCLTDDLDGLLVRLPASQY